jgi:SAM-dependent methyltransferase
MSSHSPEDLQRIYESRFRESAEYRKAVWRVLIADFFQPYIQPADTVLDLGCGYGEFINQVTCKAKYAMDLNPDAPKRVSSDVKCLLQDCSTEWPFPDNALNVVFTSNFFEHLPNKEALGRTLDETYRCLAPRGRIIAMGPNIKYLHGAYWDFWDHHLALTSDSLSEALRNRKFKVEKSIGKFMPYRMDNARQYPLFFVRTYLRLPLAWKFFGKQFLVIASK